MTIRAVIADDHPMYRYGLSAVLAQSNQITVLETVADGSELLRAVGEHHPDVVITDLSMPGLDCVAVIKQLLSDRPGVAVLVLTMHEDDEHVFAAMRAGASGYLVKGADGEEIERAVLAVAGGDAVYRGPVARRIVSFDAGDPSKSAPTRAFPDLTPREREVLALLAHRMSQPRDCPRAGDVGKTVRNHVSQVLLKLQVPDRTAAALKAKDAGL